MARVVIRIQPNDHPTDAALTPLRTRLGDIVEILEDGHVFSASELSCGHYRVVDIPGVAAASLADLVQAAFDGQGRMTKRRAFTLDTTLLTHPAWRNVTTVTEAQLRNFVKATT